MGRFLLLFVFLLAFLLAPLPSWGQITITETDVREIIDDPVAQQWHTATTLTGMQAILDAVGPNQTYDFTAATYEAEDPGILPFTMDIASVPGGTDPDFSASNYAYAIEESGGAFASFFRVQSDGFYTVGSRFFLQGFESKEVYTPLYRDAALPLSDGTTWMNTSTLTETLNGVIQSEETVTIEGSVEGYGTLVTPKGEGPALRVRMKETIRDTNGMITSEDVWIDFVTEDIYFTATIDLDGTGNPVDVGYGVLSDTRAEEDIASGATGTLFDDFGVSVAFTTASSSDGALRIFRFDHEPVPGSFSGNALSPDETVITPNVVWPKRYYVIESEDLAGFAATVCVETSGVPGDVAKVLVGARPDSGSPWEPFNTFLIGSTLCANVGDSFSQFAFLSNTSFNPLPVELAHFDVQRDGRAAVLRWETVSEVNNAGFAIEHRRPERASFVDVGFVSGHGTTEEPMEYQYRVDDLQVGRHAFRLRQTDFDGATQWSKTVTVAVPVQEATLRVAPNPVHATATVRLESPSAERVTVDVYDALGRRVAVLHDGPTTEGATVSWMLDTSQWASGIYFVRASGASIRLVTPVTVVR